MFFVIPGLVALVSAVTATVTTAGAITLGAMAGVAVTVGGLATTALASAAVFKIASSLIEDTNTGSSEYISSSQKNYEKSKLEKTLNDERQWLMDTMNNAEDSDIITQIEDILEEIEKFRINDEYYRGINHIKNYRLVYAERMNNEEVANEVERIAKKLIQVRKESKNL